MKMKTRRRYTVWGPGWNNRVHNGCTGTKISFWKFWLVWCIFWRKGFPCLMLRITPQWMDVIIKMTILYHSHLNVRINFSKIISIVCCLVERGCIACCYLLGISQQTSKAIAPIQDIWGLDWMKTGLENAYRIPKQHFSLCNAGHKRSRARVSTTQESTNKTSWNVEDHTGRGASKCWPIQAFPG